jgi:hypothetical protein
LPYDDWSGFCYNELNWSRNDFWQATIWDIVSALMFFNKKHTQKKHVNTKELIDFEKNMRIKGFL